MSFPPFPSKKLSADSLKANAIVSKFLGLIFSFDTSLYREIFIFCNPRNIVSSNAPERSMLTLVFRGISVTLRKRKTDWESVTDSHADYIRFYTSLWLVMNDVLAFPFLLANAELTHQVIIGIAVGSYILDNASYLAECISDMLSLYSVAALQRTISWLMVQKFCSHLS